MKREEVYSFDANLLKGAGDSRGEEGSLLHGNMVTLALGQLWRPLCRSRAMCSCRFGSVSGDNSDGVPKNCAEYHGDTAVIF